MTRLNLPRTANLVALAAVAALIIPARAAEEPRVKADTDVANARDEDRAAIRSAMQSFARAFESRDPKSLAAHWTAGGEYQHDEGVTARGREALEEGFSEFFARTPELKADVHPDSLRFLSHDSAIAEGAVTIRRGLSGPATNASYVAYFVREEGRWRLARLVESPVEGASIEDLSWLIGEWRSTGGQGAEIRTAYAWAPGKRFIQARFTIGEKGLALSGSQVIGIDPATGAIHAWTFEADGGVGEADWTPDGDHWVLEMAGTLADGGTLTETNILRRVDDDTCTWQSIDRMLDDVDLPDLAPVKVTRVKPGT